LVLFELTKKIVEKGWIGGYERSGEVVSISYSTVVVHASSVPYYILITFHFLSENVLGAG
ncbi:hypothetical protein ACJX0J_038604, partial [Zea mays]